MPNIAELESECDRLRALLAEKDRKAAEEKAANIAAQEASDAAKSAEERVKAAAEEREQLRRGAHINWLVSQADPTKPIDFSALAAAIPSDPNAWPPNVRPEDFVTIGGARLNANENQAVAETFLGKLLANMGGKNG